MSDPGSHVRRSGLMMPIVTDRFVNRAWTRNCDTIILDLEDSVPQNLKDFARELVKEAAPKVARGGAEVFVRVNHDLVEPDVTAAIWPPIAGVVYPKAEEAEEIQAIDQLLTSLEHERNLVEGSIEIQPMIESARGVSNAMEIASASPRVRAFGIGASGYDLSRDIGVEMFVPFDQFPYQRGQTELVARALGIEPTGLVFMPNLSGSVSDAEYARAIAEASRKAGFRTAHGLNPAVVESHNEGFTPSDEEVADARSVLELYAEFEDGSARWRVVDAKVIDRYEAARARGLIERAERCAARDLEKRHAVEAARQEEANS